MFLVDQLGAEGRLQYVYVKNDLGELPEDDHFALIKITFAEGHSQEAELGYLCAKVPGVIFGLAGEGTDGIAWAIFAVALIHVPDDEGMGVEDDDYTAWTYVYLDPIMNHLRATFVMSLVLTPTDVFGYYVHSIEEEVGDFETLDFDIEQWGWTDPTYLIQGLAVELTGVTPIEIARTVDEDCAKPNQEHECRGDPILDYLDDWIAGCRTP